MEEIRTAEFCLRQAPHSRQRYLFAHPGKRVPLTRAGRLARAFSNDYYSYKDHGYLIPAELISVFISFYESGWDSDASLGYFNDKA